MGLTIGIKGCLLFNLSTISIFTSRNCVFYENNFPYIPYPPNQLNDTSIIHTEDSNHPFIFDTHTKNPTHTSSTIDTSTNLHTLAHLISDVHILPTIPQTPIIEQYDINSPTITNHIPSSDITNTRQPTRLKTSPAYLKDFVCNTSHTCIPYDISEYVSYHIISLAYHSFIFVVTAIYECLSYKQASTDPFWVKAMQTKIQALIDNNTWTLTTLPHGEKVI